MLNTLTRTEYKPHLMMLVTLISFASISALLFTPALPSMADYFHVSDQSAQSALSIYLLGYAFGHLPHSIIANRFGRIPALNIGILVQILGCLICLMSISLISFNMMLLGRFLMALGASVGLMMAFTLLNDFYAREEARTMSAKMMVSFGILPGISLTLGGLICEYLTWQSCFYFLLAYGIVMFVVVNIKLQEPVVALAKDLPLRHYARSLASVLKNKQVIRYALMMGGCTATIYIYNALSPFLAIEQLHLRESQFGILSVIPPLGIVLGSMLSQSLNQKLHAKTVILIGWGGASLCALLMLAVFYWHFSIAALFIPMILINCFITCVVSNASVLSSSGATDKASASSVMNFINMSVGTVGVCMTQWVGHTVSLQSGILLLPVAVLGALLLMLCLMFD